MDDGAEHLAAKWTEPGVALHVAAWHKHHEHRKHGEAFRWIPPQSLSLAE